jgi:hypothetical protein
MRKVVGIDRRIKRAWLDKVLDRIAQTTAEPELRAFLDCALEDELPGKASRAKSVGIILRIWSRIPKERVALRDRALALLAKINGQERIWLHWGMMALAYPFFRDTAEVVGRLLALQDDFTTGQVQARLLTAWGDRVTSKKAAQTLLTTLVDWEVLRSTKTKGQFLLARKMTTGSTELQLWLLEALLGAGTAEEIEAQQLLRLPESFPFTLSVSIADLRKHQSFNIHRQGLDTDMVALRKVRVEQPGKTAKKPRRAKVAAARPADPDLIEQAPEQVETENGQTHIPGEISVIAHEPKQHPNVVEEHRPREQDIPEEPFESASERADRLFKVREITLVPDNPFATTSAECAHQFQTGQFYGCIALTQAVIEALAHHVWQVKLNKKSSQDSHFVAILATLHKKGFIKEEWKTRLDQMWLNRHKFHLFLASVEADQWVLEGMARDHLQLLCALEEEFFGSAKVAGGVVPNHPEFWKIEEKEAQLI